MDDLTKDNTLYGIEKVLNPDHIKNDFDVTTLDLTNLGDKNITDINNIISELEDEPIKHKNNKRKNGKNNLSVNDFDIYYNIDDEKSISNKSYSTSKSKRSEGSIRSVSSLSSYDSRSKYSYGSKHSRRSERSDYSNMSNRIKQRLNQQKMGFNTDIKNKIGGAFQSQSKPFSTENYENEKKMRSLLKNITELKNILKDNKQDMDHIPDNSEIQTISEAKEVHELLLEMYDQNVINLSVVEAIVLASSIVPIIFDGQHTFFGKRPNAASYPQKVEMRVRQMRLETQKIAGKVSQNVNLGFFIKCLLNFGMPLISTIRDNHNRQKQGLGFQQDFMDADFEEESEYDSEESEDEYSDSDEGDEGDEGEEESSSF